MENTLSFVIHTHYLETVSNPECIYLPEDNLQHIVPLLFSGAPTVTLLQGEQQDVQGSSPSLGGVQRQFP